jgi:diguanylate cyclase (GGDEF)-like protein
MFRVQAVPAPLHAAGAPARRRLARSGWSAWFALYAAGVVAAAGTALALTWRAGQVQAAAHIPELWLMAALAVVADLRTLVTAGRRGRPMFVCTSLLFTFAILLCWNLGPAILAQFAAAAVVAFRLRYNLPQYALMASQFAVASTAAYAVLYVGGPDPVNSIGPTAAIRDAASVVAAALVWLVTYRLVRVLGAWARHDRPMTVPLRPTPSYQTLFTAALLLLSPIVAVSAHVTVAFVPLVFVPLYAVERMAKLSAERDRLSRRDPLTDLANRSGLRAAFEALEPPDGPDPDAPLAMLLIDLNRFKCVNDALGHEMGDRLLVAVGRRLRGAVTRCATVARLGGDEFAVVAAVPGGVGEAERLAASIAEAMATPVVLDGLQVDISGSIGIALWPRHGADFATVMRHADVAMYQAKQRGHSYATYAAEHDHNSPERLSLLADFRQALEAGAPHVRLHYQPQVDLATGEVVGVEALLRWDHPAFGPIPPNDLLRIAEHTPVMRMLTGRVIDEVVAQVALWCRAGVRLRASLNVSIRDLHGEEVATRLGARMLEHGVPPDLVQVEITESALANDPAQLRAATDRLAAVGVAISLDDFGTGYSSLQHLRRLPLTEIKIDRSFVAGIAHNADDAVIVRSTVDLARALGLRVVAEGVENRYTARLLAEAGCAVAQGWLYAHPMPGDEVSGWLNRHAAAGERHPA